MPTTKQFKDYFLEQLTDIENFVIKPMMGEFLIYYKGVLIGGLYDNRLLIKKTESLKKYNLSEELPYNSAKPMFMIENTENKEQLYEILLSAYNELK